MKEHEWFLTRGDVVLAVLRPDGLRQVSDYPCQEGAYETTLGFEPFRASFEREVELLDAEADEDDDEWADIWDTLLEPGMFVASADGRARIAIAWVHFRNDRAWWYPLYNDPATTLSDDVGSP